MTPTSPSDPTRSIPPARRMAPVIAFAAAVAIAAGGSALAPSALGAGGGLVLNPTAGERVSAKPLRIKVRAGRHARVRARLNGHRVGECVCRSRRGVRSLRVSATHGLRHRRNVLRVSVLPRGSDRARRAKVVFRVRGTRPLAGAGRNRKVGLGAGIELDGSASRVHPKARVPGSKRHFHWRLLKAPPGSDLARGGSGKRAGFENLGRPGRFRARRSATPGFRPDLPGRYRLQLEVSADDGTRGSDKVTLRVDPDPLVPINTMAKPAGASSFGVRVGEQFYPDPGDSKQWLQLVALRPDTLELISNRSYDCPEATANPFVNQTAAVQGCVRRLSADLEQLKETAKTADGPSPIVIAVSQPPNGAAPSRTAPWQAQPPVGAQELLFKLDLPGSVTWRNQWNALLRGRMSAIGRFGGPATRHDNLDLADLRDTGEIKGFLLADNKGSYTSFESEALVPFDTLAAGSGPTTSVMTVGSQKFTEPVPESSHGGFHVLYVDRRDLSTASAYYDTGAVSRDTAVNSINAMTRTILEAIGDKRSGALVVVQSVGSSQVDPATADESANDAAMRLVDVLNERLGATRNRAYRALDPLLAPRTWSYRLIARGGTSRGEGLEAEGQMKNGLNGVPSRGFLRRSSVDYGFDVESSGVSEAVGNPGDRLLSVALSAPGDWPEKGDPGRTAAISWVGGQIGLDSRRSLYWTQPYTLGFWTPKVTKLQGLTCPSNPDGFTCKRDFTWAKQELIDEIGWLQSAHAYVTTLAEPFAKNQLSSWAEVASVAAAVNDQVQAAKTDNALLKVEAAFRLTRELSELIPIAGHAVSAVNSLTQVALEWAKIDAEGSEAGEPFSVSVADVGKELVRRLEAVRETLESQLVNVIAADHRKLRTVGLCGGLDPACPDPPLDDWQFTNTEQGRAAPVVRDGIEAYLYEVLLPVKYSAWAPPISENRSTNWFGHQPAGQTILGWECPFHDEPETAQLPIPLRRGLADRAPDRWQVIAYAFRTGAGLFGDPYEMHLPEARVTDRIFKPPADGGLGLFPESFYWRAFGPHRTVPFDSPGERNPFFPVENDHGYPLRDSEVRWITKDDPPGIKRGSCGY